MLYVQLPPYLVFAEPRYYVRQKRTKILRNRKRRGKKGEKYLHCSKQRSFELLVFFKSVPSFVSSRAGDSIIYTFLAKA